jgi:predicted  nucleic acid-binding Zn-ribbon protein
MKYLILIAAVAMTFTSCNRAELEKQKRTNDSLQAIVNERDSSLTTYLHDFTEIEQNLDSISRKQNIVSTATETPGEFKQNQKERINNQIAAINDLMEKNRQKIADLNKKLKASGSKNKQLAKMVETLNSQLAQKEQELAALNEKLANMSAEIAQLHVSLDSLSSEHGRTTQTLTETTTALHTAYYVIGKTKELKDKKIIDRQGGLLGIGRTSSLNRNVDNSQFTKIDYTQTMTIPVNSKAKIITTHPSDSYNLDQDDKKVVHNIIITNPERFWSASKYLVVVAQ